MEDRTLNYYQTEAKNYFKSTYFVKLESLWEIALEIVPENAKILDLGCGSGRDTLYFSNNNRKVVGLDYSYNLTSLAQNNSNQTFVLADLRFIPFFNQCFDLVWSVGSLLHLHKTELKNSLSGIKRVLKQDGYLLASIKKGIGEELSKDGRFFSYYSEGEWKSILTDSGFFVVRIIVAIEERKINNSTDIIKVPWIFSISQVN